MLAAPGSRGMVGSRGSDIARFGGPRVLVRDTFTRADNASSLGNAETGQAWVVSGGPFGIQGNMAYAAGGTAPAIAVVDAGVADVTASVRLVNAVDNTGLLIRYTNANNHIKLVKSGAAYSLQRVQAGGTTVIGSVLQAPAPNDVVAIKASGSSLTVLINGVPALAPVTETFNQTATAYGWKSGAIGQQFDDFLVTTP